jgi:hypothetical protein
MGQRTIHGHSISYEDDALEGVHYLQNKLDMDESKVYFDEAKRRGEAEFEDNHRWNYTLTYNDGTYVLTRRT